MDTPRYTRRMDVATCIDQCSEAQIDPSPLVGTWVNFDSGTGGISSLELVREGSRLLVRVQGACERSSCEWGEVEGSLFASDVTAKQAVGFKAFYDFGFMEILLAAYLNRRLLVVDSYNTFKDGSGRSRYFLRDHFHQ